ncbi:Ig-like domain-containing protein, partial [Thorsellia kenyensis]
SIELYDDVGDVKGIIAKGGTTDDRLPEYRGKVTDANTAFIKVYQDGQFIGKLIPVNVDGTWSYTPPVNLSGGMHNFKLAGVSKAGVEGPMSSAWNFNVLASEPSIPTLDTLLDDVGGNTIVQPDGLTNDNTPTITGRGGAGETIIIYLNGTEVTRATVDSQGRFSATIPQGKVTNNGLYNITAKAEDAAGQKSDFTLPYAFNYDGTAPNKPGLPNITDGIGDTQGKVAQGSTIDDAKPVVTGKAESGDSVVEIFDGTTSLGFATVNANGDWSFTLNLTQGSHSITVQETDKAGNKSLPSDALNFSVDNSKVELTVDYLEDNFGNENNATVQIKNNGLTNDKTPVLVGTATPGSV